MSVQKTIVRLLMKLPSPALTALAGGKPIVRDGRTLDARFAFIAASAAKRGLPETLTPAFMRQGNDLLTDLFAGPPEPDVTWRDLDVPLEGRTLTARLYHPKVQDSKAPLMVYYHFGGGVIGSVETCHAFVTMIAAMVGCPVLSVNYRLAPEHPWPAGLDDAIDSFEWGRARAHEWGAPKGRASIGGDSMGGNFSAIIPLILKERGLAQPDLQVLIYPATDIAAQDGSMQTCGEAYPLTGRIMAWFMAQYLPEGTDVADVRLSPAHASDLTGLAPALVVTAGHDPLRDQGDAYARLLAAAGCKVTHLTYDSLAHGFTAYTGAVPAADQACREIARTIAKLSRGNGR
ncbi:MAG: hypothetical protein RLZZ157_1504 [Pseudomonadota bacterium]|jgi:acetyl esterase/lipase